MDIIRRRFLETCTATGGALITAGQPCASR